MALSARDCPGCEENSIYYTFPGKPQVVRVYSLNGNKVVEKSYNFHRKKTTAPLWIVPDPR
ncbi:hypothetical protein RchiOBHm_Chr4g0427311 [Rosa chinensis]|uniref:Uncharacterized protein n=2 Tax=Rosa TaxID=3764 RepID=A0A2P6QZL1_ROSCH|nr:hypothetical protein RchiOBHm_Chr4g0427311 [Rosa chinensis]